MNFLHIQSTNNHHCNCHLVVRGIGYHTYNLGEQTAIPTSAAWRVGFSGKRTLQLSVFILISWFPALQPEWIFFCADGIITRYVLCYYEFPSSKNLQQNLYCTRPLFFILYHHIIIIFSPNGWVYKFLYSLVLTHNQYFVSFFCR